MSEKMKDSLLSSSSFIKQKYDKWVRLGDKPNTNELFQALFNIEVWESLIREKDHNNIPINVGKLPWVIPRKQSPYFLFV